MPLLTFRQLSVQSYFREVIKGPFPTDFTAAHF